MFWEIDVPKISKNIERLQIRAKSFKKCLKECFLVKLQALNLQLCRKINFTISIFQLICLPFKNNCLSKKTSKERVKILKSSVYCVTQVVFLFIFSCCSWYIWLAYDWHFTKQGWIVWIDSTYFQVQSIKKKWKHGKYSVKFTVESIVYIVYEKNI